jgi:serine/threonine-protein kinase
MGDRVNGTIGRYEIRGEIGRGSMGVVYDAYDPELERAVAVKTISVAFAVSAVDREAFEARFFAEARIAARLSHPGIVVVHDVGRDANTDILFIVLERLRGRTLAQVLSEVPQLDWRQAFHVVHGVAEALQYAHSQRVVHRDIKPANIMLLDSGDPKIMDFGIAKIETTRLKLTMSGKFFGTPLYMSPEQALGHSLDHRIDLFALGAVAYELVTGRLAFGAQSLTKIIEKVILEDPIPPSGLVPELPPDIDYVLARALAKDRQSRYADGRTLAEDVVDILAGRPPRHREGWIQPRPGAHPQVTELQAARLREETLLPPPVEELELEPVSEPETLREPSAHEVGAADAEAEIVTLVSPARKPARDTPAPTPMTSPARSAPSPFPTPLPSSAPTSPAASAAPAPPRVPGPPPSALPTPLPATRASTEPVPLPPTSPSSERTLLPVPPAEASVPPTPSPAGRRRRLWAALALLIAGVAVGTAIGTVIGSRFRLPWEEPPTPSPSVSAAAPAVPRPGTREAPGEAAAPAQTTAPAPSPMEAERDTQAPVPAPATTNPPDAVRPADPMNATAEARSPPPGTLPAPMRAGRDSADSVVVTPPRAGAVAPGRPARLALSFEHPLESGRLRLWVDDSLVLDEGLESRETKKAVVFKGRKGNLERSVDVSPGAHEIRMEVAWEDNVKTKETSGSFKAGSTRRLSARLGGVIRRNLSLEWK